MIIATIIARRQRANAEIAQDAAWQARKAQATEWAYIDSYADGMDRFINGDLRSVCQSDAERDGWDKAHELDSIEFLAGLDAYLDEMAGHDLDYLESADAAIDRQYCRWGMG